MNCGPIPVLALMLVIDPYVPAGLAAAPEATAVELRALVEKTHIARPAPPSLEIAGFTLADDGDEDGWADTNETVELRITVFNRMGFDLAGVTGVLSTTDAKIACIAQSTIEIGDVPAGALRTSAEAFVFAVADVTRATLAETFAVDFDIALAADGVGPLPGPLKLTIDLDLDASGGTGPTTYFEGFESGVGMTPEPLDSNLYPPGVQLTNEQALGYADGYRCQYNDPDWENSNTYGREPYAGNCFPDRFGPAIERFFFQVSTDRSFSGTQALYWGIPLAAPLGFTTPNSQLEALRGPVVNLGWERVCAPSRATACASDLDCPVDEACVELSPTLSFKHQVSFMDHRVINMAGDLADGVDRSVVQLRVVDAAGQPVGPWVGLDAYINPYDTGHFQLIRNCSFDPVDDGNNEDAFFDPADPARRFGPSSTCHPLRSFVHQGDTFAAFDPHNVGDADGPGLEGESGDGTWVQPVFDLSRYRGRRVEVRLLSTGIQLGTTWQDVFQFNPTGVDDGWFLDDFTITDTLVEPATVVPDTKDNLDLEQDHDFDGVGATCDCAPEDAQAWLPALAVSDLRLETAEGGATILTWTSAAEAAAPVAYDVLVSRAPDGFGSSALTECVEAGDASDRQALVDRTPAADAVLYFLVRASHTCGPALGADSSNTPRTGIGC